MTAETQAESDPPNRPPPSYPISGWRDTGTIRIRTGWFGFAIVEELYAHQDGAQRWRRLFMPKIIAEGR